MTGSVLDKSSPSIAPNCVLNEYQTKIDTADHATTESQNQRESGKNDLNIEMLRWKDYKVDSSLCVKVRFCNDSQPEYVASY